MSTLFGIALGAGADAFKDTYKTFADQEREKEKSARDERRVTIAENADRRAAASAAATARALEEARKTTAAENGGPGPSSPSAVSSVEAPEAPSGTVSSTGAAPATSALTEPTGATPASAPSAIRAVGVPEVVPLTGEDSIVGAAGEDKVSGVRASGVRTSRTASGDLSGTAISRTGASSEDGAIARLRELARGGNISAGNRLREIEKARIDKETRDRDFKIREEQLAIARAESRDRLTNSERKRMKEDRAEASAMTLGSIDEAMRTPGVTPETSVSDPKVRDSVTRALDMASRTHSLLPDRRAMTHKVLEDGSIEITITPKMGGTPTKQIIRNLGELDKAGRELSVVATNPEATAAWLRTADYIDYARAAGVRAAELEKASGEENLRKARDIREAGTLIPELRKEIEAASRLTDTEEAKKEGKTSVDRARELIRKITSLDRAGAMKLEDIMTTDPTTGKPIRAGKKEKNIWEEQLKEAVPAAEIKVPKKGGKEGEMTTVSVGTVISTQTPRVAAALKAGKTKEEIAAALDRSLAREGWSNPYRRKQIILKTLEAARGSVTDSNDPGDGSPSTSATVPSVVPGDISSAIKAARDPSTPRMFTGKTPRIDPRTGTIIRE